MANPNYSSGSTSSSASSAQDSYENLKSDISSLAETVKKLASDQMGSVVAGAQDQVQEKLGNVESMVRKNPTQSAMVAAGIGFVVGLILSR